jgi:hypothetical protein
MMETNPNAKTQTQGQMRYGHVHNHFLGLLEEGVWRYRQMTSEFLTGVLEPTRKKVRRNIR